MTTNNVCGIEISRDTFKQLDSEDRDAVIFDCLKTVTQDIKEIKEKERVEAKKLMWFGGICGFCGGVLAVLAKIILPF